MKNNAYLAIFITVVLLALAGCLAIYNVSSSRCIPFYYHGLRQFCWTFIGACAMFFISKIPSSKWQKWTPFYAIITWFSLPALFLFGITINQMTGWFAITSSIHIQPSEFTKIPFVLSLVAVLCSPFSTTKKDLYFIAITFFWIIPIALQPDFGTMSIYLLTAMLIYWIGNGSHLKIIGFISIIFIITLIIYQLSSRVQNRIHGFLDPFSDPENTGWHILQFRTTLAHGGWFGHSSFETEWAPLYLPLPHSDSAFASIIEAVGFIPGIFIIIGFFMIPVFAKKLMETTTSPFAKLTIIAIPLMYSIQALVHIAVNTTTIPITGITLPLLSYGGSSLVSTFIAFGVVLSLSQATKNKSNLLQNSI